MSKAPHLDAFLSAADYFLGATPGDALYNEMCNYAGYSGYSGAWCAVFVLGCAGKAGVLNSVIAGDSWAADVLLQTADECGGEFFEGPGCNGGVAVTPSPGDLVTFSWDDDHFGTEHASHVGIVNYVSDGYVHTYEGNTSGTSAERKYSLSYGCINMYVRPDWSRVGDDVSDYPGYTGGKGSNGGKKGSSGGSSGYTPLYTSQKNDRHDMTLREVCYMDDSYQLTNKPTGMSISIMNYTNLLRDLYDYLNVGANSGGDGGTSTNVDTSNLAGMHGDNNIKNAVDYLLDKNYSASGACGVVGCLITYSVCQPTYSRRLANGSYLEGIGAWESDQVAESKQRSGSYGWNINLSGQMDYLLFDLNRGHKELVDKIWNIDLGSVQAMDAAKAMVLEYNKHYLLTSDTEDAQNNAKELYDALIFTQTNTYSGGKDLRDIDGRELSPQFTVDIPRDLSQAGIDGNYTSYSYFYNVWDSSSPQRVVADNWAYQGFPYDRGSIALVGGYYCIATTPTFGYVGDVVVVTLANGDSFAGILADIKNPSDDNYCEYGHYYGNGLLNVIEWERIVTYNGEVQTKETGAGATLVDSIELGSWAGQDVVSITNYGSYL